MRLVPDTIAGRTIAVLLGGLVLFHLASVWAYQIGVGSEVDLANEARLAERLVTIHRAIAQLPSAERESTAHWLSGGPLEVHWSNVPLTVQSDHGYGRGEALRRRVLAIAPDIGEGGLVIGSPRPLEAQPDDPHLVLVSMRLADGGWVNYSITKLSGPRTSLLGVIFSTSLMALGVVAVSIGMVRTVTRPLRSCAAAAQRLYVVAEPHPLAVSGPREVRDLARAFNELQQRVKRLIDDRTLMLAAISHDLKAPLTRVQLRLEEIENVELRRPIEADLAEMLSMIEATLEFLKGDQSGEAIHSVDLGAVLGSIASDLGDAGHTITVELEGKIVVRGRRLALKRAFANLVTNAVTYGRAARIKARRSHTRIEVAIDDEGPGIPAHAREAVFAPFYRIENSRNRATGGTGLGLTVARTIIDGHGGSITLDDRPQGGLRVTVHVPLSPEAHAIEKQNETRRKSS